MVCIKHTYVIKFKTLNIYSTSIYHQPLLAKKTLIYAMKPKTLNIYIQHQHLQTLSIKTTLTYVMKHKTLNIHSTSTLS